MKIIQSCGSNSWGGLEMQTLKLAEALTARGHEVLLLCTSGAILEEKALEKNLKIYPLPGNKAAAALKIRSLLKSQSFEVIHTHLSNDLGALIPGIKLANWGGKLFLTKRMGSGVSKKDLLHRALYARLDGVFAISHYIRENVLATCPVVPEKVKLLPNALDTAVYNPDFYDCWAIRRELLIDPETIVVGMIGRMTPKKGHREFLQAASIIKRKTKQKILFVIVGNASQGETEYESDLHRLATEELDLKNDILWTGFRSDIARLLSAMDILAFPSYREAFGTTLLEAMAMCVPIVASNSGGVPDIIENKRTGLLVQPQDPQALAGALLKLIKSAELRKHYGISGRMRVEEKFSFDRHIKQLENYYQKGID